MTPIYNVVDNGKYLTIEFKEGSIVKESRPGWKTFFVKKEFIKRAQINGFKDLDNFKF